MHIQFKVVRWKNLLSTGNVFTEIRLDEHASTLIVGENGAGKSTLIEAISFALYGKPFRNINKPNLVNSINQKNLVVELEFSIGAKEYFIRRGIKPTIFEIVCDGVLINQDASARDYQEVLEKNILRLSHKSFSQIVTLGSTNFVPFMQLTAQSRRDFIEDLLDIQIFSTMNVMLKNKIQENKESLISCASMITLAEQRLELGKKHLQTLKRNTEELIAKKEEAIQAQEKLLETNRNAYASISDAKEISEAEFELIKPREDKYWKLLEYKKSLTTKFRETSDAEDFYSHNTECPMCKQGIDHEFQQSVIQKIKTEKAEYDDALLKLNIMIEESSSVLARKDEIQNEIRLYERQLAAAENEHKQIVKYIKSLQLEIEEIKTKHKETEHDANDLKKARDELKLFKSQNEQLSKQRSLYGTASFLLKDGGIKSRIIKQYVPIVNKLINKYLASMDFFVEFNIDESFKEQILSRHRDDFTYASFSEGEKVRIDLALLLTWRAISKLRNSSSTNLLIMDEVFDSSLDTNGIEELMKIFSTLTNDTNIFVISHKGDTLIDKFTNVITFEKHKNFSSVRSS